MSPTYELIDSITLSSDQSSVSFDNIPQTYDDLKISISARSSSGNMPGGSADILYMNLNSTNMSSVKYLYGTGSSAGSATSPARGIGYLTDPNCTANTFSSIEIYIPEYTSSNIKTVGSLSMTENNSSTASMARWAGTYSSVTSAVSSITFTTEDAASFVTGSTFELYGIKNADDGSEGYFGPAARGGDEVYTTGDGYKVHVFKTSGTLEVTSPGEVEALVVAGGGGGGSGANSGGGGAGGMQIERILLETGNNSVIIGAGGTQGSADGVRGNSGNNSTLISINSIGGGGGGSTGSGAESVGRNGGSGGGGGLYGVIGGSGVSGQGNSGGTSQSGLGGKYSAGGGGGAGQVGGSGGTASVPTDGVGGNGISTSISGLSTYYSGGGGGGSNFSSGGPIGGLGGGGRGGNSSPSNASTAGSSNTGGGGGGGASSNTSGSAGGSGIVIIRYKV